MSCRGMRRASRWFSEIAVTRQLNEWGLSDTLFVGWRQIKCYPHDVKLIGVICVTALLVSTLRLTAARQTPTGSASLRGVVSDENNKGLPNVSIEVRDEHSSWAVMTTTHEDGVFLVERLPAGYACLTARLQGYGPTLVTHIDLENNRTSSLQIKLASETVRIKSKLSSQEMCFRPMRIVTRVDGLS
jgi:Carboxypeptidase regulatory-like domain